MNHTEGTTARAGRGMGKAVGVETLEHRVWGGGGGGGGGDDDRFRVSVSSQVATADFNNDKKLDTVALTTLSVGKKLRVSAVVTELGQGNGLFVGKDVEQVQGTPKAIVAGDFNGDGNQDVAVASASGGVTSVQILLGDGKGNLAAGAVQTVGNLPLTNLSAGDITGDGRADLVSWDSANVYESLNNGTGTLLPATTQSAPQTGGTIVAFADVDGDARPDLLTLKGGQLFVTKAQASTGDFILSFLPTLDPSLDLTGKKILVGDVNGDGLNDLIAVDRKAVYAAIQGPTSTFGPWVKTAVEAGKNVSAGDVNGDGKVDLVRVDDDAGFVTRAELVLVGTGDGTFHKLQATGKGHGPGHDHDGDDDD